MAEDQHRQQRGVSGGAAWRVDVQDEAGFTEALQRAVRVGTERHAPLVRPELPILVAHWPEPAADVDRRGGAERQPEIDRFGADVRPLFLPAWLHKTALKCSYRSDRVTRDRDVALILGPTCPYR